MASSGVDSVSPFSIGVKRDPGWERPRVCPHEKECITGCGFDEMSAPVFGPQTGVPVAAGKGPSSLPVGVVRSVTRQIHHIVTLVHAAMILAFNVLSFWFIRCAIITTQSGSRRIRAGSETETGGRSPLSLRSTVGALLRLRREKSRRRIDLPNRVVLRSLDDRDGSVNRNSFDGQVHPFR